VALKARLSEKVAISRMAITGTAGFDVYVNEGEGFKFYSVIMPPLEVKNEYENISRDFGKRKMREIMIHFPLYSSVDEVYLGHDGDSKIKKASPYKNRAPIVY
jgi:hypothetical protein